MFRLPKQHNTNDEFPIRFVIQPLRYHDLHLQTSEIRSIIGDKSGGIMTRSKLKDKTCLISQLESRTMKDALDNDD